MRYLLLLLLLIPLAHASSGSGHMTLLTVAEDLNATGGVADLYLDVRPGSGAIFIDSFPLTRLDTQGSTRYANQIACDFLQVNCQEYDFFYTIRAGSSIVGGPSAGAAIAVLTVAVLDGEEIAQDTAMTGTINSGGLVGPVGGVTQKVTGAKYAGMRRVLIPLLSKNDSNATRGKVESLSDEEIEVIRVGTLEEALELFTGSSFVREYPPVVEPPEYQGLMEDIAYEICSRTASLKVIVKERNLEYEDTNNYTQRIEDLPRNREYSRASLCFSSNIELNGMLMRNRTQEELYGIYGDLFKSSLELGDELSNREITTLPDLEVYSIVQERLLDAQRVLQEINRSAIDPSRLAYAEERLVSANSWKRFFGLPGEEVQLDEEFLKTACFAKIIEAEERINYVRLYSEALVAGAVETLAEAHSLSGYEPIQCIFTAGKAKAQANLVASALFVEEEDVRKLIEEKLKADDLVLRKQAAKGHFPLLGYSYTRYAEDLKEEQPYSALTFAEYALELSNLDLYFPQETAYRIVVPKEKLFVFFFGAVFGACFVLLILRRKLRKPPKKRKKGP